MQSKSVLRISNFTTPMMIACGLLVASSPGWAQDTGDTKCTNRSLLGDYGFTIEGITLTNPGVALPAGGVPLRGVAMTHFDGKGKLTQIDHVVFNGAPPPTEWTAGAGTYSINADCTGSFVINIPGSPFSPVKVHFVVVRQGKEIRTVVDGNGPVTSASTSIGIKVE